MWVRTPIRATPRFISVFRPSIICAAVRAAALRTLHSNIATAVRAKTTSVSGAIGRGSTRSRVPRYGVMPALPPCEVELFGRRYAAPIGVSPMGGPAIVWPGADEYFARAAQKARIPYTLGTVGCSTIERIAALAPDVFWFQLYRAAKNNHAIGFDLAKRAQDAGCHALMLTLDVPVRTTRAREVVVGLSGAFNPDLTKMIRC